MDIDAIEAGVDFVDVIHEAVGKCDVLLAVIGPDWLSLKNDAGERRIDEPGDFVRIEIEAALSRDVRVIPVLVDGGRMPSVSQLPASLATFGRRHALEISDARWGFDAGRLVESIEKIGVAKADDSARIAAAVSAAEEARVVAEAARVAPTARGSPMPKQPRPRRRGSRPRRRRPRTPVLRPIRRRPRTRGRPRRRVRAEEARLATAAAAAAAAGDARLAAEAAAAEQARAAADEDARAAAAATSAVAIGSADRRARHRSTRTHPPDVADQRDRSHRDDAASARRSESPEIRGPDRRRARGRARAWVPSSSGPACSAVVLRRLRRRRPSRRRRCRSHRASTWRSPGTPWHRSPASSVSRSSRSLRPTPVCRPQTSSPSARSSSCRPANPIRPRCSPAPRPVRSTVAERAA